MDVISDTREQVPRLYSCPLPDLNLGTYITYRNKDDDEQGDQYNQAPRGNMSLGICTNQRTSFAFLKIYGMHHGCTNHHAMVAEESRVFNTTAERVQAVLDFEILSRLQERKTPTLLSWWALHYGTSAQVAIVGLVHQTHTKACTTVVQDWHTGAPCDMRPFKNFFPMFNLLENKPCRDLGL